MDCFDGMLDEDGIDAVVDMDSQRPPVAFEMDGADVAATDLEFVKPEFGDVRRVSSFVSLDDLEVGADLGSMPVFGVTPKQPPQQRDSSPEEDANNNSNECVAMDQEEDSMVVVPTPKPLLISSYSIEAISSIQDIEKMSGPLLRGYLKSVGIEQRGNNKKRSELMEMLSREFMRYQEDPQGYLETVAELRPAPVAVVAEPFSGPSSSKRRTKKRSLKAREAEETRDVILPSKKLATGVVGSMAAPPAASTRSALSPTKMGGALLGGSGGGGGTGNSVVVGGGSAVNGSAAGGHGAKGGKTTKLAVMQDPPEMTDAARLARYEAIARQIVWARDPTAGPSTDKNKLLQEFCSVFGFNAQGVLVGEDEQIDPPLDDTHDPLGRRIDVLWMEDVSNTPKWFTGTAVRKVTRSYQVIYDDGEDRVENLRTKRWRFAKTDLLAKGEDNGK